jgi:transposase InsO family protein
MIGLFCFVLAALASPFKSKLRLEAENAVLPIAPASPWQNGFAERLIGSIRRECLDHVIVLGELHLRRILKSYADYYNCDRTHRSLDKDAPVSRPIQRTGVIS